MTLSNDLMSKKNWTQDEINGLKEKYNRTHFTHFTKPEIGGNERVKVKTADGYTFVSRAVAEDEGLEIVPKRRRTRRTRAEVKDDIDTE
jgi:hypothetical protein